MILSIFPYLFLFLQVRCQVDPEPSAEKIHVDRPPVPCKPIACLPVECSAGFREVTEGCECPKCENLALGRPERPPKPSIEGAIPSPPPIEVQCNPCRLQCGQHTRLVQDPTRCHNPRCVGDGYTDPWEEPRPPGIVGLCLQQPNPPIECGNGTILFKGTGHCPCDVCVLINQTVPLPACTCLGECGAGTRLVEDPTKCHNPRCVADGYTDEWEIPRPPGQKGLCLQEPDPPIDCGNGTIQIRDKSICGCPTCIPIPKIPEPESIPKINVSCEPCEPHCEPGTRLVHDPTRCKRPRCTANNYTDEWENPRLPILGLCQGPPPGPANCGNGTRRVQDNCLCSCPKCFPIDEPEPPKTCPQACEAGTRLVEDPRRCHLPRCVADGYTDEWENPIKTPGLCRAPPEGQATCGNGTKLVQDKSTCGCHRCIPINEVGICQHCPDPCVSGTRLVNDPTRCNLPRCTANGYSDEWEEPRTILGLCEHVPEGLPTCGNGTRLVQDKSRCGCPRCIPYTPIQESIPQEICPPHCEPGTRLVEDPTRCKHPRCVANGYTDDWEIPRQDGFVGLCQHRPPGPATCGNGTKLVEDNSPGSCPRCIPINQNEICTSCPDACEAGTRTVPDPRRCHLSRCVANGYTDDWENPITSPGLCHGPPEGQATCGNGTILVQDKSACGCHRCIPSNGPGECLNCPNPCVPGTRLVDDPTRCNLPRCTANGYTDEWETPRPPGFVGLCEHVPEGLPTCGNGTKLIQDKSRCGCPRCVPIKEPVPCNCRGECAPGTRLVHQPTRCHNPRCVADGFTDPWENPRPPGLIGLCYQPLDVPIECGNGTIQVRDKSICGCPRCIPANATQPDQHCPVKCEPGTRLVEDPTKCNRPRCTANGYTDRWEKPSPPGFVGLCQHTPPGPATCGNGTRLVQDPIPGSCPRCIPIGKPLPLKACSDACEPGTRTVKDPRKCNLARCVAEGYTDEWENSRIKRGTCQAPPEGQAICGNGTKTVQDGSFGCYKCVPMNNLQNIPLCPNPCVSGTRLVHDPTRCNLPRCTANGYTDHWETPRTSLGLCKEVPEGLPSCGNGTRLIRDIGGFECPRCVPIQEPVPCNCRGECAPGTRLVHEPTRCHNPRCVADGFTDEWEKPRPRGLIGLCYQPLDVPIDCGNGTIEVHDKSVCGCPRCIPAPANETVSCDHCPDPCIQGTRLVEDPTRCNLPRCTANGYSDEWENPRHNLGLCHEPPKGLPTCGNGTRLIQDKSRCGCPRCVPIKILCNCPDPCVPGTRQVDDPTRCHLPRCVGDGYTDEWEQPRHDLGQCHGPPLGLPTCGNGTILVRDKSGCGCPRCFPNKEPEPESYSNCLGQCGPGTRLVKEPTRCHNPRCVADGYTDPWEKPRPPGIIGLCYQPPDVPIDCGNGTKLVHDKIHGCPICIRIDSTNNEPCEPIACPFVLCPLGTVRVNDPTGCSCPKCVPEDDCDSPSLPNPPCQPLECPLIFCDEGSVKWEDPLGCKCPVCLPVIGSSTVSIGIIGKPWSCKQFCPFLKCGQGEPAARYLCGCPRCEAIEGPANITLPVKPICLIVCPQIKCAPGYFPQRPPGVFCACPRCVPYLARPPRCNGLVCPPITCPESHVQLDDPLGCRCPLCHSLPASESLESIQIPIQCKFICPEIQCPPGQSPHRNPKAICACPECVPDDLPPPPSILNDTICDFVCPSIKCPEGQLPLRDPRVRCGCPKCHPIPTPCLPLPCLHVECPVGSVKLEDPQGCRCPICHNITAEEADEGLIGAGILCDFICKPPTCPPGYFPQRDPHHACGCKHCVLQNDLIIDQQHLTFDFACPSCPAGTFPFSEPGVRRGCPLCVPFNSTLISCQPRICPQIHCENGTIKLEDPEGCRCPICHRPPESSQEAISRLPIACGFICPPVECSPGQVARRDPRYVCGCPKCYPTNGLINQIWDKIVCKFACPPLICPAGQVPTRTGKMCQCPICA